MQTVNEWLTTPTPLLALPDDANPAQAYPAQLLTGTLPPKGVQQTLDLYNRLNQYATPIKSLFKRKQGSLSNV